MSHGWFHLFSIANQNVSVCYQTVAATEAGEDIAVSNKETLIAGGPFVLPLAHKHKVKILPADSEHFAIFQVCWLNQFHSNCVGHSMNVNHITMLGVLL